MWSNILGAQWLADPRSNLLPLYWKNNNINSTSADWIRCLLHHPAITSNNYIKIHPLKLHSCHKQQEAKVIWQTLHRMTPRDRPLRADRLTDRQTPWTVTIVCILCIQCSLRSNKVETFYLILHMAAKDKSYEQNIKAVIQRIGKNAGVTKYFDPQNKLTP